MLRIAQCSFRFVIFVSVTPSKSKWKSSSSKISHWRLSRFFLRLLILLWKIEKVWSRSRLQNWFFITWKLCGEKYLLRIHVLLSTPSLGTKSLFNVKMSRSWKLATLSKFLARFPYRSLLYYAYSFWSERTIEVTMDGLWGLLALFY